MALASSLLLGCGGRVPAEASDNEEALLVADADETPNGGLGLSKLDSNPVRSSGDTPPVASNHSAVEGSFFREQSPLGTTLEVVEVGERICVRGEMAPVPEGDYPNYWGAEVGFVLVSSLTDAAPAAEALSTPGFAFRLQGTLPPLLRFRVGAAGEVPLYSQYCQHVDMNTGVRIEVPLAALTYECWNGAGQPFPASSGATLMAWQIPANESSIGSFDFCIEDIQALQ